MTGEFYVQRMRSVAACLPAVVSARDRQGFAVLVRKARRTEDLYALIALLAESADPGRLGAVTGYLVPLGPREAHAVFERLKRDDQPVPAHIREGERRYQAGQHQARKDAATGERAA